MHELSYNGGVRTRIPGKTIHDYFRRKPEVEAVYVFGSRLRERARADSDLDIAVLLNRSIPEESFLEKRLRYGDELSSRLEQEPDIVLLNEAGPVLVHQVLQHGRLLFERAHQTTLSFQARAMIDYVDWLPYKILLDQAVLKHFRSPHG